MKNTLLSLLLLAACSPTLTESEEPQLVGAADIAITGISLYQGPEIPLAEGTEALEADLPIIGGRDALVRVFYSSGRPGDVVTANLELANGEVFSERLTLVESSSVTSLSSTLNFKVPGEFIKDDFEYKVSIVELGEVDHLPARHPDVGFDSHPVEPETPFKVTIVPFTYNADGSGRRPSTSSAAITAFENRFRQLYPISEIEVNVRQPLEWSGALQPNGAGWQEAIIAVYQLRQRDGAADDEYYYGMFNPTQSVGQFCSRGCLLGVTLLNNTPETVGDPLLRMALGVGFSEVAADTMLHELGHAHGRSHAPCGPGVSPDSVDADYPHAEAKIGGVSYDIVTERLIGQSHVDLMSYCDPAWISDYNYEAMYTRMDNIRPAGQSRTVSRTTAAPATVFYVHEDGSMRLADADLRMPRGVGEPVQTQVMTASGMQLVDAELLRYDHLPGGLLVLPIQDEHVNHVAIDVDGEHFELRR